MEVKQDFHKQKTTPWPWQVSCSTLHTVLLEDAICQGFLEYRARCNNIPYPLSSWPLLNAQGCSGQMLIWQIFHSQEDFSAILPKSVGVTWGREFPLYPVQALEYQQGGSSCCASSEAPKYFMSVPEMILWSLIFYALLMSVSYKGNSCSSKLNGMSGVRALCAT